MSQSIQEVTKSRLLIELGLERKSRDALAFAGTLIALATLRLPALSALSALISLGFVVSASSSQRKIRDLNESANSPSLRV